MKRYRGGARRWRRRLLSYRSRNHFRYWRRLEARRSSCVQLFVWLLVPFVTYLGGDLHSHRDPIRGHARTRSIFLTGARWRFLEITSDKQYSRLPRGGPGPPMNLYIGTVADQRGITEAIREYI